MSERARLTGRDVLDREQGSDCPLPGCDGALDRTEYKDTDALVCADCDTPAVRVWGDRR